jgi:hypothetical protein
MISVLATVRVFRLLTLAMLLFVAGAQQHATLGIRRAVAVWGTSARDTSFSLSVPADTEWIDAHVYLTGGMQVTISARGKWSNGRYRNRPSQRWERKWYGAKGYPPARKPESGLPVPTANVGALVGRIGTGGTPFLIKERWSRTADQPGELYLGMNDLSGSQKDNQGALTVTITLR